MTQKIDARGLSCPQPVLLTLDAIAAGSADQIQVMVDNETARENVTRAAESKGWSVSGVQSDGDEIELQIQKG